MNFEQVIEQAVANAFARQLQPIINRLNAPETPNRAEQEKLLNTKAAAEYLGVSPITMAIWRVDGRGPEFTRMAGRLVRYRQSDLDAFVTKNGGLVGRKGRPPANLVEHVKTSGTSLGKLRRSEVTAR